MPNLWCRYTFWLKFRNQSYFQSVEVVDRGSEKQLQVTENFNSIAQRSRGLLERFTNAEYASPIYLYILLHLPDPKNTENWCTKLSDFVCSHLRHCRSHPSQAIARFYCGVPFSGLDCSPSEITALAHYPAPIGREQSPVQKVWRLWRFFYEQSTGLREHRDVSSVAVAAWFINLDLSWPTLVSRDGQCDTPGGGPTLAHRLRRWPSVGPAPDACCLPCDQRSTPVQQFCLAVCKAVGGNFSPLMQVVTVFWLCKSSADTKCHQFFMFTADQCTHIPTTVLMFLLTIWKPRLYNRTGTVLSLCSPWSRCQKNNHSWCDLTCHRKDIFCGTTCEPFTDFACNLFETKMLN